MRTTITVDDQLFAKLKRRASQSGTSVSRLVEQAIWLLMRTPPVTRTDRFELITFGEGGRFTTRNVDKTSSLLESDDIERFGGR